MPKNEPKVRRVDDWWVSSAIVHVSRVATVGVIARLLMTHKQRLKSTTSPTFFAGAGVCVPADPQGLRCRQVAPLAL